MMNTNIPLGIISCGTGNDIIRALQIPNEPLAALDIALNGQVRDMDAACERPALF